jgi:type I restriction enzyme M protein
MDVATWALAKMNMILHGYATADIYRENVITDPGFATGGHLKQHDFVVANPPFSTKSWSNGITPEHDEYARFEFGVPPAKNGDYAFLLHAIKSLKSTGKAAIILPHGVLFRGGAEAVIRRELLKRGLVKGVVGLPANLFYGTGIPACIVVIDKEGAEDRDGVFLVDASRGCRKDGPKNRLRAQDIHKIVDVFTKQLEVERYSRLVPLEEIASEANDYNLNIPRYVDASEPEDIQDLDAHLNGGIPDRDLELLSEYWEAFAGLRDELFEPDRPGYSTAKVEMGEVQTTIHGNQDFKALEKVVSDTLNAWWNRHRTALKKIEVGSAPKPIIHELSEDLLRRFTEVPLLGGYDVYEQLMLYWDETMQDDIYLVSAEGWVQATRPRGLREISKTDKGKPKYEEPDLVVGRGKAATKYKLDLVPAWLVIERYFPEERAALKEAQRTHEQSTQALEAYVEEHGTEDGALAEVVSENGKVAKRAVTSQIKAMTDQSELEEELAITKRCLELIDAETTSKKAAQNAETELAEKALEKYDELNEEEIKELVVDEKWIGAMRAAVSSVKAVTIAGLTNRISQLDSRYAHTLNELLERQQALDGHVAAHIEDLGLEVKGT